MNKCKYLLFALLAFHSFSFAMNNPAVAFCEMMGYEVATEKDSAGGEYAVCVLPDGSKVDAWAFFTGKVKPEYSYCERHGYNTQNRTTNRGLYTTSEAVCMKKNSLKGFSSIPLEQFMARHGDTLDLMITDLDKPSIDDNDEANLSANTLKRGTTLPESYDSRVLGYVNPIRNQGSCGNCYAYCAVASSEILYNKISGSTGDKRKKLSEAFITWCAPSLDDYSPYLHGCDGGVTREAFKFAANIGICETAYFPNTNTSPLTCDHWNDPFIKHSSYNYLYNPTSTKVKELIMEYGSVGVSVNPIYLQLYSGGIITGSLSGSGHAVNFIGWGKENGTEYWIIRNSWGTNDGEGGYYRYKMSSTLNNWIYWIEPKSLYDADNISENCQVPSDGILEFNGHNKLRLNKGFSVATGGRFIAKRTAKENKPATEINIEESQDGSIIDGGIPDKLDEETSSEQFWIAVNKKTITIYSPVLAEVTIYDIAGRSIKLLPHVKDQVQVNMSEFTDGIYNMHIKTEDNVVVRKLILK